MASKKYHLKDSKFERRLFIKRLLTIGFILTILFAVLITRLYYLQIRDHQKYTTLSQKNQINVIPIPPNRGVIYDRNGVLLADNVPVYSLEIIPDRVKNLKQTIKELRKLLPSISEDDLTAFHKQLRQHRRFEPVPLRLTLNQQEVAVFAVNQYHFPGVLIQARLIRNYPYGAALSHVLGYVGRINLRELQTIDPTNYAGTNFIGKSCLEKHYEDKLHGTVGYEQVETDASGRVIRSLSRTPPVPGDELYLTLDNKLELIAEQAMGPVRGALVAIDPNNGEILAFVSAPGYDPSLFEMGISKKDYQELSTAKSRPLYNRAIHGQYPFGSTIKPFLALGAYSDNVVDLNYKIYDPGWFKLPNGAHIYHDWKKGGHGVVNAVKAVTISCDIYFYTLANLMGIKHLDKILHNFGFGRPTQVDMPDELPGVVASPDWKLGHKGEKWYPGDTINSGIGQGFMLVTPLQLANGAAIIAGRGKHFRPHLVKKFRNAEGQIIEIPPIAEANVNYRDKAWDAIIGAMHAVITVGTGYRFGRDAPYTVAAKTGTAQNYNIKNPEEHYHAHDAQLNLPEYLRDNSLFIAFAPVDKPKIAIAVIAENSTLAAGIARKVFDAYLLTPEQYQEKLLKEQQEQQKLLEQQKLKTPVKEQHETTQSD